MDNLTGSLKDAQSVNINLENILGGKRKKRILLEEKLEKVNSQLAKVQDQHSKLTEVWKVEQHKVNQTQAQNDRIEKMNGEKRQLIQSISHQIDESQQKRISEISVFVEALSKVANKILQAKDRYTRENLRKELDAAKREYEVLCSNSQNLDEEVMAVKTHLESLQIDSSENVNDGIDRDFVWKILSDQQETLQSKIDNLKQLQNGEDNLQMTE